MPIRLRLNGGVDLEVDASYDELYTAFQAARRESGLLEIRNADGALIAVNPQQILYLQPLEAQEPLGSRLGNGASVAEPVRG